MEWYNEERAWQPWNGLGTRSKGQMWEMKKEQGIVVGNATYTDKFNAYLALSNFSNFTTNRWCTPNARFFMVIFSKLGRKKTGNWRFSKLKGKKTCNWCICTHYTHEKTCIWCTPSICFEIRKIGQRQIGVKIISVGRTGNCMVELEDLLIDLFSVLICILR